MSRRRAETLIAVASMLNVAVRELDDLQAGDYQNRVSPIKHELRDALAPIVEKIRQLAQEEYLDREGRLSLRDEERP